MLALSKAVEAEIVEVFSRWKFVRAISAERRQSFLSAWRRSAIWFDPTEHISDCRDLKGNKYQELALAAGAETIVSGDLDLLVLHPWRGVRILRSAD